MSLTPPRRSGGAARREALRDAPPDERAALLDSLAVDAGAGAADALELLLWAVDEFHLARPAVRRLVAAEPDVDDIVQDVLIAVAETIGSFRNDARFTTWLHQVARYKAIAWLRRQRDQVELGGSERDADRDVDRGDAARMSSLIATRATVQRVVDELPDLYRAPVVLRDVDQRSYEQIAETLTLPMATVRTRVARGRALAAARLKAAGM